MPCYSCGRNFHEECLTNCEQCHPISEVEVTVVSFTEEEAKKEKEFKNPESTGRKRAAMLYPLDPDKPCEWQMQKNCGGGLRPIVGCLDGKQQSRHHGPDKNTMNNSIGNVHRICHTCHVRFHELNDPIYDQEGFVDHKHAPVAASIEELWEWELSWKTGEMKKKFDLKNAINKKLED